MIDETADEEHALFQSVYAHLRSIAGELFAGGGQDAMLQPTAIVHEAFLKLAASGEGRWEDETHFLAVAAKVLRQVLTDHYRSARRAKRGGGVVHCSLDTSILNLDLGGARIDPVDIDEALSQLAVEEPRAAEVVEFRFFGGMTNDQIAARLGVSVPTVERDWRFARAWLHTALAEDGGL